MYYRLYLKVIRAAQKMYVCTSDLSFGLLKLVELYCYPEQYAQDLDHVCA